MRARYLYYLKASAPFSVRGREELVVNLRLRKIARFCAGAIAGRVSDETKPVKRATVLVLNWLFRPVAHAVTDEQGAYCVHDLRPGLYFAVASARGYATSGIKAALVRARRVARLSFELKKGAGRSGGIVYGKVTEAPSGNPVAGAAICLSKRGFRAPFSAVSNEQGQYLVYGLPPGEWRLSAGRRGYAPSRHYSIRVCENSRIRVDVRLRQACR